MESELYRTKAKSQGLVPAHFALIIIIVVHVVISNNGERSELSRSGVFNGTDFLYIKRVQ